MKELGISCSDVSLILSVKFDQLICYRMFLFKFNISSSQSDTRKKENSCQR